MKCFPKARISAQTWKIRPHRVAVLLPSALNQEPIPTGRDARRVVAGGKVGQAEPGEVGASLCRAVRRGFFHIRNLRVVNLVLL